MVCSTGLGAAKSEGPDPVLPTFGKVNTDFVVEVVSGLVAGVGWLVGNENVGPEVVEGLEVVVVGGAGVTGLGGKLGTAVLVVVVGGSDFTMEGVAVVVAGLAKKLGTAGCARAGTVDVGVGVGVTNKLFAGSLVSVVVVAVVPVVGFGCVEVVEGGVNKLGVVVLVTEVVAGLNEIVGAGVEAGEGFFPSSITFFWS